MAVINVTTRFYDRSLADYERNPLFAYEHNVSSPAGETTRKEEP